MDKRTQILDVGEELMKRAGYSGFSYADVAKTVEIRKASIHYHFPTKADLAQAAVERYRERAQAWLTSTVDPQDGLPAAVGGLAQLFADALAGPGQGCLCGSLAADWAALPEPLRAEIRTYWDGLTSWLAAAVLRARSSETQATAHAKARLVVSLFQGALMSSRVVGTAKPLQDAEALAVHAVQS